MFQRLRALAIFLIAGCLSAPALAADPTGSSVPFANGGTTYNEWTYNDGTRFYVGHLNFGWTGTAPKAWTMDTNGYGDINVENWPSFWPYTLNGDGGVPSHVTNGPTGYALEAGHAAAIDISTAKSATAAGTPADAAYTGSNTASLVALLKANLAVEQALLAGPLNIGGSVNFSGSLPGFATTPTFNLGTAPNLNVTCLSGCSSSGGGGAVTNVGTFAVQNNAATPAGSNTIGTVNLGTIGGAATATTQGQQLTAEQAIQAAANTIAANTGASSSGAAVFYNGATGATSALAASAIYTGPTRDVGVASGSTNRLAYFNAFFFADQTGTAYVDCSNDNTTWYTCTSAVTGALSASTPLILTVPVMTRYHRARVVNGATAETTLYVNTSYTGG